MNTFKLSTKKETGELIRGFKEGGEGRAVVFSRPERSDDSDSPFPVWVCSAYYANAYGCRFRGNIYVEKDGRRVLYVELDSDGFTR